MSRRRKKIKGFKKVLLIYFVLLLIVAEIFLIYVSNSLKGYENGDINNYMNSLISDLKKSSKGGRITKYISISDLTSEYEKKSSLEKGYKEKLSGDVTYKKKDTNVYEIYTDNDLLLTVTLDDSKTENRLGLLQYTNWEIKDIKTNDEEGLYKYDIYVNDDYTLYINDVKVNESDLVEEKTIKEFSEVEKLVTVPKEKHYFVDKLTYKPEIIVKDKDGKKVEIEYKDGAYYANSYFNTDSLEEAYEVMDEDYDPIIMAENYSLFLTSNNISSGRTVSFNELTSNLIKGTTVYQRLYEWATGIDRTFMSFHSNDAKTFTNEKVSNITVYNENAFSAEVYLEKNMTLAGGDKRVDVLHEMYYFVYYEGAYRLVYTKTVTEK